MIKKISLIILAVGIIIILIMMNIISYHDGKIGGTAIDGKTEYGKYFVLTESSEYKEVGKSEWITNMILWVCLLIVAAITMITLAIAGVTWLLIPAVRRIIN